MQTRANTYSAPILGPSLAPGPSSLTPHASRLPTAFTLVELLMVVAIMTLAMGILVPSMKGFFDGARLPDARNLISASLTNARNYAVTNNITIALVFVEDDDPSNNPRRTLMFLAEEDLPDNPDEFIPVPGRKPIYLPDDIIISFDNETDPDTADRDLALCFLPAGQLAQPNVTKVTLPDSTTPAGIDPEISFYIYDSKSSDDPAQFRINYYTGTVIEQ